MKHHSSVAAEHNANLLAVALKIILQAEQIMRDGGCHEMADDWRAEMLEPDEAHEIDPDQAKPTGLTRGAD